MASSDLAVSLKITGNAKGAVTALEDMRKAQLTAFVAGREATDKAAIQQRFNVKKT